MQGCSRRSGIELLDSLSQSSAEHLLQRVRDARRPNEVVVVSLHWGSNWGCEVPDAFVRFAHQLIRGGVDVVHGHSSHHVRPIEVYRNRLILYGCGDFLSDYEGIAGYEDFRGDLALLYFAVIDPACGELIRLRMVPVQSHRFRLRRPEPSDVHWIRERLASISAAFGSTVTLEPDGSLSLHWTRVAPPSR